VSKYVAKEYSQRQNNKRSLFNPYNTGRNRLPTHNQYDIQTGQRTINTWETWDYKY